jgi:PadR family transcriptional regulator PadR
MNSQYKKGVIELCVLALLYKQDRYGYDISEYLSGRIGIADGTVYPVLRNLKSEGYVTTYLSEESGGPPRKYYSMTKTGKEAYLKQKEEWLAFSRSVESLLEGEKDVE